MCGVLEPDLLNNSPNRTGNAVRAAVHHGLRQSGSTAVRSANALRVDDSCRGLRLGCEAAIRGEGDLRLVVGERA